MKIDSSYLPLRQNLGAAHSGLALQLSAENNLSEALKEFHQAVFLDPDNRESVHYLNGFIGASGKKWDVSADRIKLGDEAKCSGDLRGAVVEYLAALQLKNHLQTRKKLSAVYELLDDSDKALARRAGVIPSS
jgi:tetratricopeptide (TPR) repeat protein